MDDLIIKRIAERMRISSITDFNVIYGYQDIDPPELLRYLNDFVKDLSKVLEEANYDVEKGFDEEEGHPVEDLEKIRDQVSLFSEAFSYMIDGLKGMNLVGN